MYILRSVLGEASAGSCLKTVVSVYHSLSLNVLPFPYELLGGAAGLDIWLEELTGAECCSLCGEFMHYTKPLCLTHCLLCEWIIPV